MTPRSRWKLVRFAATYAALLAAWFLFSGSIDLYSLIFGGAVTAALALFTYQFLLDEREAGARHIIPNPLLLVLYIPYILYRIFQSSFILAWQILTGKLDPRVVHFRTRLHSDIARITLCASITLTPGTITILIDDDHLLVHCFSEGSSHSKQARKDVAESLERFIARIWS